MNPDPSHDRTPEEEQAARLTAHALGQLEGREREDAVERLAQADAFESRRTVGSTRQLADALRSARDEELRSLAAAGRSQALRRTIIATIAATPSAATPSAAAPSAVSAGFRRTRRGMVFLAGSLAAAILVAVGLLLPPPPPIGDPLVPPMLVARKGAVDTSADGPAADIDEAEGVGRQLSPPGTRRMADANEDLAAMRDGVRPARVGLAQQGQPEEKAVENESQTPRTKGDEAVVLRRSAALRQERQETAKKAVADGLARKHAPLAPAAAAAPAPSARGLAGVEAAARPADSGSQRVGGGGQGHAAGVSPPIADLRSDEDRRKQGDLRGGPAAADRAAVAGSYDEIRRSLAAGRLPPKSAVRVDELIAHFRYDDPPPQGGDPFSVTLEAATSPWREGRILVRVGLKERDEPGLGRGRTFTTIHEVVAGKTQPAERDGPNTATAARAAKNRVSADGLPTTVRAVAIPERVVGFEAASDDLRFAAAVAAFGGILRGDEDAGEVTLDTVARIAESALGRDPDGSRAEFVAVVRKARDLLDRREPETATSP